MANENIVQTRIQLKHDTYANWDLKKDIFKPLPGEICIAEVASTNKDTQVAPTILFKVGAKKDSTKGIEESNLYTFNELPWASALAADVYEWAKKSEAEFTAWVAKVPKTVTLKINNVDTHYTIEEAIKLVRNEITAGGEAAAITIADQSTANLIKYVAQQGGTDIVEAIEIGAGTGITIAKSGTATPTINHQAKPTTGSAVTPTAGSGRTYVTEVLVDTMGHIAGVKTATESDQVLPTSKDFGVLSVTADDDTITVDNSDPQNPKIKVTADTFDAYGSAAELKDQLIDGTVTVAKADRAYSLEDGLEITLDGGTIKFDGTSPEFINIDSVISNAIGDRTTYTNDEIDEKVEAVLGTSTDGAAANTVYGAKAAAAAAQNDATIAKTKIETFLGTVTPDGSDAIIDTLAEINKYVGDHGQEFSALSGKVTNIENGITATKAGSLTSDLENTIKGYTVANATNAADSAKLGGQAPTYYATAASVTDITKSGGTIDTKIANKVDKVSSGIQNNFVAFGANGAIKDSGKKAGDFATAAQGTKADNALPANGWNTRSGELYTSNGYISLTESTGLVLTDLNR